MEGLLLQHIDENLVKFHIKIASNLSNEYPLKYMYLAMIINIHHNTIFLHIWDW